MKEIKKILICGGGMMGKGIAQIFSQRKDLEIIIYDKFPVDVYEGIRINLTQLKNAGVISEAEIEDSLSRIKFTQNINSEEVKSADLVVECVLEILEMKQDLFAELESIVAKDTIFCTNTSVMSPTEISKKLKYKNRLVGTHFWNPAYLIPLVEVVKSDYSDDEIVQQVHELLLSVGKKSVICKKDVPGFIANRMQHALWREAIYIVEQGIADAKTVDDAVKYSFGLRLPQLAPLENADMVGTDLTYNIHDYVLKNLCSSQEPSSLLKELKEMGKLGFKSGEGFQKWTDEEIKTSKEELVKYLIKMIYKK
ncbi:MAG: 3-hydroxyacyl-CoA dehydrogenase family protein [Fusobacterium gastrosuis]|uniref:3-hydroxyacyl-CoA dehydrogenase family protein n=1 Tax=Fusobacterium gastrosuis TaxID=1755100 RepID=UPI0025E489DE|nr:3-hydroxyacyl-CoA dehydrogenase family protein [uncultured Fusobacterium sp.]MDY4010513.1 3-hydroxyacyl-CoA dehydrogenase family protein [Fusobacterium gastrosuis]